MCKKETVLKKSILIIDDNIKLCKSLSRNFEQLGYGVIYKTNTSEALKEIREFKPDVILLDVALGDENGLDTLKGIKDLDRSLPVIMITGYGSIEIAVEAIKLGAFDFIQKPLEFTKLSVIVENAQKMGSLDRQNSLLKTKIKHLSPKIVSNNTRMMEILKDAKKLAATKLPILIQGESGTGKEGLSEYIHNNSDRCGQNIIKINCSAFPENLLDNELFGHVKGAFTGALNNFKGVFEKADGGTLLLDEIGDMSLQTQAKILRTLQNSEIRPIGSESTKFIDVRFIASSNKDLKELIRKGQFREDLYYRLSSATFYLPPLSDRMDDIPLLVEHFLDGLDYTEQFLAILMASEWRGNIRELKNVVSYAAAINNSGTVDCKDLPPSFMGCNTLDKPVDIIRDSEKSLIITTLQKTNYNKKKTSELLNISRKTLYNKMERYGIS